MEKKKKNSIKNPENPTYLMAIHAQQHDVMRPVRLEVLRKKVSVAGGHEAVAQIV